MAAAPSLLKPKRLMTARSRDRRNRRGRGLPGCGRGVAAPTSTKPKPARPSAATAWAFLSRPAARPSGFGRSRPARRVASRGEVIGARARAEAGAEAEDGEPVRGLGIEAAQERQAEIGEAHGRPSSTGRDQRTSVLASGR